MKWIIFAVIGLAVIIAAIAVIGMILPKAHVASRLERFRSPPAMLWDLIAGPPTWRPNIRTYDKLPERGGRPVWKETDKHGQSITFERVVSTPPRTMVNRIDPGLPFGGTWTYDLQPDQGGTLLTITEHGEVYNPFFRFVSRYILGHTATIDEYMQALRAKLGEGK